MQLSHFATIRNTLFLVAIGLCALALATLPASAQAQSVTIANLAYSPATVNVTAGSTVTWTNQDQVPHTVTSTTGAFDSGQFQGGQTFQQTFNTPGTFPYTCTVHPQMQGSVVVAAAGGGGGGDDDDNDDDDAAGGATTAPPGTGTGLVNDDGSSVPLAVLGGGVVIALGVASLGVMAARRR